MVATAMTLCAADVHAGGDGKLVLATPDGETEISVGTISQITFDGTQMTIATTDGTQQIDVMTLENIRFDLSSSAVETVAKDFEDGMSLQMDKGVLTATAGAESPVTVDVYNLNGVKLMTAAGQGAITVNLNTLAPGVYVVKANNKTIKFAR